MAALTREDRRCLSLYQEVSAGGAGAELRGPQADGHTTPAVSGGRGDSPRLREGEGVRYEPADRAFPQLKFVAQRRHLSSNPEVFVSHPMMTGQSR